MLYDRATGKSENLTESSFDRNAANLAWSPDSKAIYFVARMKRRCRCMRCGEAGATPKKVLDGFNAGMSLGEDGKTLLLTRSSLTMPAEIFVAVSDGSGLRQITHANDALLAKLDMNAPETFWFDGAEGSKVQRC